MDSTQGLLSFMTNASRQIKTFLGPEQQKKNAQSKTRHQQLLLQLTQLKTQNFNFIPDILESSSQQTLLSQQSTETSPASPTPSLDSVGSHDDDETPTFRTSCLMKSRRKKRLRNVAPSTKATPYNENTKKRARYNNNVYKQTRDTTCAYSASTTTISSLAAHGSYPELIPSPSPDFDDLVDCMLTEDALANIDVNNYFSPLQ